MWVGPACHSMDPPALCAAWALARPLTQPRLAACPQVDKMVEAAHKVDPRSGWRTGTEVMQERGKIVRISVGGARGGLWPVRPVPRAVQ